MSRFVAYLSFSVAVNCRSEEFLRHTRKFLSSDAFIAAYSMSSRDFGLPATDSRHNRALPATDSHRIRLSEIDLDDDADPNHETHQQEHERHDDIGRTADAHRALIRRIGLCLQSGWFSQRGHARAARTPCPPSSSTVIGNVRTARAGTCPRCRESPA